MCSNNHHHRNANQNHTEIPIHTYEAITMVLVVELESASDEALLWNVKDAHTLWETAWQFLKRLSPDLPYNPAIPLSDSYSK